eukprot:TRINITY_DN1273_c0_g1_i1.p1 TRINITY_DN1273_c0_g1~~TRINITY_DN1273_c0_g1_i1.p1  ORF type:complete len:545 (+),score=98.83 TRINITY_DN1273_c0_g1_i1:3-1637(+)
MPSPAEDGVDSSAPSFPEGPEVLHYRLLKRTRDMFLHNRSVRAADNEQSQRVLLSAKIRAEYASVVDLPPPSLPPPAKRSALEGTSGEHMAVEVHDITAGVPETTTTTTTTTTAVTGTHPFPARPGVLLSENTAVVQEASKSSLEKAIEAIPPSATASEAQKQAWGIVAYKKAAGIPERLSGTSASTSRALSIRRKELEQPTWHPPWKLMRVISGHTGWVRSVAMDPTNEWFVTGSADRTLKIWDLASGTLKLTLTGHVSTVRGVVVSERHPYLFSVGEDKTVKCWDLEQNKVIRSYHGHLSGVYCVALHPTIDVLVTGSRDSTIRVWDVRTKSQIHALSGHSNTVCTVATQSTDPQVISGSMDHFVKLWDLGAGRCAATLTNHKKSVRSAIVHPTEYTMASASADNIKKWKFPEGSFLQNISGQRAVLNALAVNRDNVLVAGADNGNMDFFDWKTGYNFQQMQTRVQPGSLESEAGIFGMAFDRTGSRLIVGEADKSIKVYKEDDTATLETHPIHWNPSAARDRYQFPPSLQSCACANRERLS